MYTDLTRLNGHQAPSMVLVPSFLSRVCKCMPLYLAFCLAFSMAVGDLTQVLIACAESTLWAKLSIS